MFFSESASLIQRHISALILILSLLFTLGTGYSAPTSAGTSILNQAVLTYNEADFSEAVTAKSNTVDVVVQSVEALVLTTDNSIRVPSGTSVALPHRLTNTGNVATTATLSVANASGDDYDLTDLKIIRDLNSNGHFDSGEPVLGQAAISLAVGASIDVLVAGTVPSSVTVSQSARAIITATSAQGIAVSNTDNVQSSQGLSLQVALSASVSSARPNETVVYGVSASNLSMVTASGVPVIVDGAGDTLVVLRDPIPANTAFVSANTPAKGTLLYHVVGAATHTYTTTLPSDLTRIDAIAIGFPSMAAQAEAAFTYTVRLNDNASGDIYNQARLYFNNPVTSQDENIRSNTVQLRVPELMPTINYYMSDWDHIAYGTSVGRPLYVEVIAARCNLNPSVAERIQVTIRSKVSGDVETYEALETAPNSGIFHIAAPVPTRDEDEYPTDRNGWLETDILDVLTATAECNGVTVTTTILVDPLGVVFDSKTNANIAGATVTLIDVTGQGNGGNAGGPATVFEFDSITPAPSTVITGANGAFQFPMVAPSTYKLAIVPPTNYAFPSAVAVGDLPGGRIIDPAGSYGGNFLVSVATGAVTIDVPLDASESPTGGLFVEKSASRRSAEIGDFVDYQVKVRNSSGNAVNNVSVLDVLPANFVYVKGTTRRQGAAIAEPLGGIGPRLNFSLGNMANGDQIIFSYRLRIAVGAKTGEAKNRASASGTSGTATLNSNNASASVRVSGGVLNSKGILLGRVFVDLNKNGVVNEGEPGIPGVRLYLENGTYVITDGNGMYDVYGLDAQTHVVKVDTTTLPAGSKLSPITSAHANKGDSAFVDLKSGELHKTNFAEISATPAILAEIKKRNEQIAKFGEVDLAISRDISSDVQGVNSSDSRSLLASGIVNEPGVRTTTSGGARFESSKTVVRNVAPTAQVQNSADPFVPTPELSAGNSNLPEAPVAATAAPNKDADSLPSDLTAELGFADFMDGDRMAFDQANVRVKGALNGQFTLKVNGEAVSGSRLGTKITVPDAGIAVWEYVGVRFKAGNNELEVSDETGATAKIKVLVPGSAGKIEVTVSKASVSADAKTLVPVKVRLMDAQGTQISARTPLTLESTKGRWQVTDLNPSEPGTQVFIEGGSATFNLIAPSEPGDSAVRVSSGVMMVENKISFVPELRPLVAAGLVDAKINLFNFKPRSAKAIATTEFEDELRGISLGNTAAARAAMFAKGQILGKYLLTLRYDSQNKKDDRLFRDIQPDEYYPVYGDDAVKGYDAQSTSRLYVRVDKEKSYLLMGDYSTTGVNEARSLGEYNRSFNGVRAHHEDDKLSANFWATRDNSRQLVDELRGRGTSGPYALRSTDLVEQSEKVEIIVRDRNQPSVILSVTPQSRFLDYQYDSRTGGILFNRPIPSVDSELNPVFVRVSYEINQGGPKFNVAGVDAQYKLSKNLEVGAAMIRDENPQNKSNLRSVNATYKIAEGTTLIGEWAQTKTDALGTGDAKRLELLHQSDKLTARAFIGESDTNFDNPASILSAGRKETSLKADYKMTSKDVLKAEAIRTQDIQNGNKREGGQISLEHTFPNDVRLEVGMRHAKESQQNNAPGTDPVNFTSARVKVTAPVPNQPRANVFAEYEQDIKDSGKKVFALGGNYQLNDRSRLYIRHELLSSLDGRYALNDSNDSRATLVGIDTDYAPNAHVFSEYRINNGVSGRESETALGLRNGWEISKGLRVNTTFEKVRGEGGNNSTAITGAVEYTALDNLKSSLRLESRSGTGGRTLMAIAGAAYKVNDDMTVLAKAVMHSGSGSNAANAGLYDRLLLGWAYRQSKNDRLNALAKFEWRRGSPGDAKFGDILDKARILSFDANYQAGKRITLSGHYAAKWSNSRNDDLSSSYFSQLASARITRELDRRSNVSLMGSVSRGSIGNRVGLGIEYNYLIRDNMWLGLGYNSSSLNDADLLGSDAPGSGFYARLRWKFDENLFGNNLSGTEGFAPNAAQPQMPLPIATP